MSIPRRRIFVHLAYLDDSDTKGKASQWQVMSGVIVEDKNFKLIEYGMSAIQELLVPADRLAAFEEFHACELYGGYGVFEGIGQEQRFDAIRRLLDLIRMAGLSVVYGAVDLARLRNKVYASADPLDISFRICLNGIHQWTQDHIVDQIQLGAEDFSLSSIVRPMVETWFNELMILIVDECPDRKIRDALQKSFRNLRSPRIRSSEPALIHFHDDMYFGDSRYSIGIQLADLCSYFIARHLQGDSEIQSFYEMIEPHIVHSQIEPEVKNVAPIEGVPAIRHDDEQALEGSTQRDQEETGSGESGEGGKAPTQG
jgi:hypothetical protein